MGVVITFLKEIRKDLARMETKIDEIKSSIVELTLDIKQLKGKPVEEMLEMRFQDIVSQTKIKTLLKVYIDMFGKLLIEEQKDQ